MVYGSHVALKTMDFDRARSELSNAVYEAAILCERFEDAGKSCGNGHHQAQNVAAFAVVRLAKVWNNQEETQDEQQI